MVANNSHCSGVLNASSRSRSTRLAPTNKGVGSDDACPSSSAESALLSAAGKERSGSDSGSEPTSASVGPNSARRSTSRSLPRVSSFAVPNAPTAANEANGAMRSTMITSVNAPFTQSGGAGTPTTLGSFAAAATETKIANATTRRLRRESAVRARTVRVFAVFDPPRAGVPSLPSPRSPCSQCSKASSRTRKNGAPITATAPPTTATSSTNRAARLLASFSRDDPASRSGRKGTNVAYTC